MIQINGVSKYFGQNQVLKNVSMDIEKGEIVSIIGPSGSGKSTLLRCINLLEIPEEGKIFISGEEITNKTNEIQKLRMKLGMVFQQFYLFPHMTVLKNITYAPVVTKKKSKKEAEEKAEYLLELIGLKDKRDVYPSTLSGGQKQRVAIARTLAMEPEAILFDEPTSALDPEMVKEVLEVIHSLACTGITMVLVTHEMGFAREISNCIYFLDEGNIVESGHPKEFFHNPSTNRAQEFLEKIL